MDKHRLQEEINYELSQLEKITTISQQILSIPENQRKSWDATAAAKYIADFILGLENILKRKNTFLDCKLPEGPDFHHRLLNDFLNDKELGSQLSDEIRLRLKKYLRFRHRFIHGYGHEVNWEIVQEPLQLLPDTVKQIQLLWQKWLSQFED